ncbi:hypothetical protein CY35_08G065600 [Sphagnum magellanicum]|nr:hypothetical protein CY35_08G065600 [Sphagnum magellanicum]KAH9554478.1 hypothetical protein CY35_08G065600 [Sphagnum magellanicum]
MSLRYAEKLSYKADVGTVGMPELFDSALDLKCKVEALSQLIKESQHLVVFTGAGISTSCGIPDFRGPKGIWTLQHEGKPMPKIETPFHQARPGLTHMALVQLQRAGILKFIISQNIDGLHLRSGIPRSQLAELHGNCFRETCSSCGKEYFRDFEVETLGCKPTGRRCSDPECGAKLIDTIVDWEEALPPADLKLAEKHSKKADLILCLGTSLQITPACNLPLKAVRAGGKMVIVNLQATPKDKKAELLIRARVDELNQIIPPFVRIDRIRMSYYYYWTKKKSVKWLLRLGSSHGDRAPLPFITSVEVNYPNRPDLKQKLLKKQPFVLRRETMHVKELDVSLTLHFGEGCMCVTANILQSLHFEVPPEQKTEKIDMECVLETVRSRAAAEKQCGEMTVIDVQSLPDTLQGSAVEFAIVTSVVAYTPILVQVPDEIEIPKEIIRKAPIKKASNRARKRPRRF